MTQVGRMNPDFLRDFFGSSVKLASAVSMGGKPSTPGHPSELASPEVQVLRVGSFNHPKYGEFDITKSILRQLKDNFDNRVRGVDIAVDYFHKSDEQAAGWFKELYLTEDDSELWARVDWTPDAQRKLHEREIRYFSPDFAFEWTDPESGVIYKNVLFGGGLTNRPFVKDMAAIVAAEEKEKMDIKELAAKVLKLEEGGGDLQKKHDDLLKQHQELQKQCVEMKEKLAESGDKKPAGDHAEPDEDDMSVEGLKKKLDEVDGRNKALEKELADLKASKKMSEKEAAFTLMLTEGKVCAAQKEAFMKDDMSAFAKLAQPINLSERGTAAGSSDTGSEDELAEKVLKLAEKIAKEEKVSLLDAITKAKREVK